jgi:hypothetical protein
MMNRRNREKQIMTTASAQNTNKGKATMESVAQKAASLDKAAQAPAQASAPAAAPVETATPKVDTKALWASVRTLEAESKRVQAELDSLLDRKSDIIKAIKEAQGAGPFQVAGLGLVTIRSRKPKEGAEKPTYFFVSMGSPEITTIE